VCLHGILPGFAAWGRPAECGYAGCHGAVVAKASRVGWVCRDCLGRPKLRLGSERLTLAAYITRQVDIRDGRVQPAFSSAKWVWFE
jgi:hypothetical protein